MTRFHLPFLFPNDAHEAKRLNDRGSSPMAVLRSDWEFQKRTLAVWGDAINEDETVLLEMSP